MENEVLIAILTKLVEDRLASLPAIAGPRGPRGRDGVRGEDGRGFVFADHEASIKTWVSEFSLKFEDLSTEQLELLRGPRGRDGADGKDFQFAEHSADVDSLIRKAISDISDTLKLKFSDLSADEISALRGPSGADGKGIVFEDHADIFREWARGFALKFEDLNAEQIEALRGPRGRDGSHGRDGNGFVFEEHKDGIERLLRSCVSGLSDELKLRFSDLSEDERESLRGPRGKDGRAGRDFIFDEHREFFESLKFKFSDFTEEELAAFKLQFSHLTEDEKASLKLQFKDLTEEDRSLLRGPRGARGQRGASGRDGNTGPMGPRGLPGPTGITGRSGSNGRDGTNGYDAPYITSIEIEQENGSFNFIFIFSDGSEIRTDKVVLPQSAPTVYVPISSGGSSVTTKEYEERIDEVSLSVTYIGKAKIGAVTDEAVWQIERMSTVGTQTILQWANNSSKFNCVWDDRADLTYGS